MKVSEFVEQYKNAKNKEQFITDHITREYVPYLEKVSICQAIVNQTMYKQVGENKVFWKNTPTECFLFGVRMIDAHTDIEIDSDGLLDDFDNLNSESLIDIIMGALPEHEYKEFREIMSMVEDDEYENNRSIPSFLETKMNTVGIVINTLLDAINSEDLNALVTKFSKE